MGVRNFLWGGRRFVDRGQQRMYVQFRMQRFYFGRIKADVMRMGGDAIVAMTLIFDKLPYLSPAP